jgi:ATP-binding cassette subfamily B protein
VPVLVELVTVTLVLIAVGQPALTGIFAASAVAYLVVLGCRKAGLAEDAQAVAGASVGAHGMLTDALVNCETIKCFNAGWIARDRFTRATRLLEDRWAGLQRQRLRMRLAAASTFALSVAAPIAFVMHAVAQGETTVGGFVLPNVYMLQLVRPLEMLGTASREIALLPENRSGAI